MATEAMEAAAAAVAAELVQRGMLRREIRDNLEQAQNRREELQDLTNNDMYSLIREKMNEQESHITHVREMQLDALVLKELATVVHHQGVKLQDYSSKLNMSHLINTLKRKYSSDEMNNSSTKENGFPWATFGRDVGVFYRGVPHMETMYGPVFREAKVRKQVERKERKREGPAPVVKAAEVVIDEEDKTEEASNRRQVALKSAIRNLSQRSDQDGEDSAAETRVQSVEMLPLLVDPQSLVQTIENIFDFSFLVKSKEALITEKDDIPMITLADNALVDSLPTRQRVFSLNIRQVKKLMNIMDKIHAYESQTKLTQSKSSSQGKNQSSNKKSSQANSGNTASGLLHRENDLYAASSVWQQAEILAKENARKIDKSIGRGRASSSSSQPADASHNDSTDDEDFFKLSNTAGRKKSNKRKADQIME